jgi:hypothetical protein
MRTAERILCFGLVLAGMGSAALRAQCTPSATDLCLFDRFTVDVTWVDSGGGLRAARAESFPPSSFPVETTGYFWFSSSSNLELVVKMVDECSSPTPRFWFFYGSLTDVEYTIRVVDTGTLAVRTYSNTAGERTVVTDTEAFESCPPVELRAPWPAVSTARELVEAPPGRRFAAPKAAPLGVPCTPGPTTLCLVDDRLAVELEWETTMPAATGMGQAVPVTDRSGAFWFFSSESLEVGVKVVETCPAFEVHYAGLSDVEYTLTVTDTATGAVNTYVHAAGPASAAGDLTAFPRPCLFGDGFESGDVAAWSSAVGAP